MAENDDAVETTAQEETDNAAYRLAWFFTGAVIGAAAALLLAPQSGAKTRKLIGKKTQEGCDAVAETGKEVFDRGKEVYEKGRQVVDDAADLFERGRKLVRG